MKRFNKVTPEGTKDILFEECLARREVSRRLAQVFQMRGYNEVITPGIEYYDVFDAADAAIPQYEMYKSTDNKGRLIVFRPDLTLPIARLTATRLQSMEKPVRLYYNQPVYRNRKDLSGRSDESMQAGVDDFCAEVLPADKAAYVAKLRREGHTVLMVGDGINDSPALSEADAGIAISDGAAIAREIADITIAADNLWELAELRRIAMALMKRIHSNYCFVIGFNGALIASGVLGVLPPAASAMLHNLSTLGVSLRSMSSLNSRLPSVYQKNKERII